MLTTHQLGVALLVMGAGGGGKEGWLIETELPEPPAEVAGDLIS